ncbi:MAG: TonB-dependent receptor [Acidobacteriota bacterium]
MRRTLLCVIVVPAAVLFTPVVASAQAAISGVVRDGSGGALPGVTVEASSPALIERTRNVVSDGAGQYRIVDLRPGTYAVTFTLSGFKTVRREGILLEGSFTAPVNVDLELGTLEETVTVTGESPVVDVVGNRQTLVVNRDMLDAIPTSTRSLQARANLIPGTTVTAVGSGQTSMTIFGSQAADQVVMVDGMRLNLLEGSGQFSGIYLNDGMAQEISYDTGAQNAEVAQGGLRVNMIPREGGNTFSGIFFIQGANGPLSSDNRSDAVRAFIPQPLGISHTYEINPSIGGPIKRDKLWFYFTYKLSDTRNFVTLPDRTQGFQENWPNYSYVTRLTWQITDRDKIRIYNDNQMNGQRYEGLGATTTREASHQLWTPRGWTPQVQWTQATTNRLMLEAGLSLYDQNFRREPQPGVNPLDLPRIESLTSVNSGSYAGSMDSWTKNYTSMASATYVTGSHSIKAGMNYGWGRRIRTWPAPNPANILALVFLNNQPAQVSVRNTPIDTSKEVMNADLGLYAQDAWTIDRLTLNIGGRYDYFNAEVPALSAAASTWVPARERAAVPNVPNWHDFAVRLAAAYDLFGTGKTALKVNVSKYVASAALGFAQEFNTLTAQSETRTWVDRDGNRSVLDASGNLQRDEIVGGTANFGLASGTSRPDPNLKREYNWEYGVSVQHELLPRVSVQAGYHRRTYGNLIISDNLNLSVDEWTPFTITAPRDERLPGGGGFPITMYTLNPNKVGTPTDNLRTFSTSNSRVYNGVDLTVNARIGNRAFLLGGITTERLETNSCDQRDNPNSLRFCDASSPFRTILKASGAYELPFDFQISGAFYARPGADIAANYTVTSAIAGRPIIASTAGASQISVNLIEPNTMLRDYINNLDVRITRTFRLGRYRLQGLVDIYNLLNAGTVTTLSQTYGSNPATNLWSRPQALQTARYVRFGAQLNF